MQGIHAFVEAQDDADFAGWFMRLGDGVDQLRQDGHDKPERPIRLQPALIDLVDFRRADSERSDAGRERPRVAGDDWPISERCFLSA
jgi:hypothetical protein